MKNLFLASIFVFILLPAKLFAAGISITEIMYDAEGSDSGREWIEIYNGTGGSIDLTKYKFFEAGVSHGITALDSGVMLVNNSYVIIAENATNFSSLYSSVPKSQIYDSSFSLSNTAGEYLAIKDENGNILFDVTYDVSLGAAGDGKTLQLTSGNSWVANSPTFLSGYTGSQQDNKNTEETNNSNNQNTTTETTSTSNTNGISFTPYKKDPEMLIVFDTPKNVVSGIKNTYKATVYGYSGELVTGGKFIWNFGDGNTEELNYNNPVEHIYIYPGEYTITLSYKYNWYIKTVVISKINVTVIASPIKITKLYTNPFPAVGITNTKDIEYDIGGYVIRTKDTRIIIPEATYIGPKDEIVITLPAGNYKVEDLELVDPSGFTINKINNTGETKIGKNITASVGNSFNTGSSKLLDFNDQTYNPKLINLDEPTEKSKKNYWPIISLLGVVAIGSTLVFVLRKKNSINLGESDEYALQDE